MFTIIDNPAGEFGCFQVEDHRRKVGTCFIRDAEQVQFFDAAGDVYTLWTDDAQDWLVRHRGQVQMVFDQESRGAFVLVPLGDLMSIAERQNRAPFP